MTQSTPQSPTLYALIWSANKLPLLGAITLNLANAGISMAVLAFINHRLLGDTPITLGVGAVFVGLIGLLFLFSFISQYALTWLGHRFVYELRTSLVKRILDTDTATLENIGSAKILASLSVDIQSVTMGFVRLPELVQGLIVCLCSVFYLLYLSPVLTAVVVGWLALTVVISLTLVRRVYHYLEKLRMLNDELYAHYQSSIDGAMPLKLNRHRAERIFTAFTDKACEYRTHIIRADSFHISAINFSNIMVFFGIGVVLIVAELFGLASRADALTASLTMLFVQSPLLKAVGAYPVLQSAQVGFDKMQSLNFAPHSPTFTLPTPSDFDNLTLKNVYYQYPAQNGFALSPVSFSLTKGEVVFLVGDNGSGKTTLAKVLTGLYAPTGGEILFNNQAVTAENVETYRQAFSAIFSEVYLFDKILGANGGLADDDFINKWLTILKLDNKITLNNQTLSTTKLSQGQKKRLALLIALCEHKPIMLLDEWAADQDPEYRKFFYDTIIPTLKAMSKTLFVISHDDRFFDVADRLLVMKNGVLTVVENGHNEQH